MIRTILFFFLLVISPEVFSQDIFYVGVPTLALKEFPDTNSRTLILLHAPCKVMVNEVTDKRFSNRPEVKNYWGFVRFFISDGSRWGGKTYKGFIYKPFLAKNVSEINIAGLDTTILFSYTELGPQPVKYDLRFFDSAKGGCFYINAVAKKEYVKFCK